jgi:hypothetical protein
MQDDYFVTWRNENRINLRKSIYSEWKEIKCLPGPNEAKLKNYNFVQCQT